MAGYYALLNKQGPSLYEVVQNARQAAQQKRQLEFAERQAAEQSARQERAEQRSFERETYERDAATRDKMAEQKRLEADRAFKAKEAETKRIAGVRTYVADMAERDPSRLNSLIGVLRRERALEGITEPDVVDALSSEAVRPFVEQLRGSASGVQGAPKPTESPRDARATAIQLGMGLPPGTPEAAAEYERRRLAEEAAERRKNQKDADKEKALPPSSVNELSDAKTAAEAADRLLADFMASVPTGNAVSRTISRGAAFVPNTDTSQYGKTAGVAAQVIGTFLEGGKLQAADYDRYKSFLPAPGDDEETARKKVDAIKVMIGERLKGRRQALQDAGYRAPGERPSQTQRPTPASDAELDAYFDSNFGGAP